MRQSRKPAVITSNAIRVVRSALYARYDTVSHRYMQREKICSIIRTKYINYMHAQRSQKHKKNIHVHAEENCCTYAHLEVVTTSRRGNCNVVDAAVGEGLEISQRQRRILARVETVASKQEIRYDIWYKALFVAFFYR